MDQQYNEKKRAYESITSAATQTMQQTEKEVNAAKEKVQNDDTRISYLNYQSEILEVKSRLVQDTNQFNNFI